MENTQTQNAAQADYRQLLDEAQSLFARNEYFLARQAASQALAAMLPLFSDNNPLLAKCYKLNGEVLEESIPTLDPNWKVKLEEVVGYFLKCVEVLEKGMASRELYDMYQRTVVHLLSLERAEEALPLAEKAHELRLALLEQEALSLGESLIGQCLYAEVLYESGRHGELKTLVWDAVRHLRAEHFHDVVVIEALQQLLQYQKALLQEEEAVAEAIA